MVDPASALSASAELLERLIGGQLPLDTVGSSLADVAHDLGVKQVMVAIDDAAYGRQVFCSDRRPLGGWGELLAGPPRVGTDPPVRIDHALSRLIVAAVATAFERARTRAPAVENAADLEPALRTATDRAARYGWGFTLVLMAFDQAEELAREQFRTHLRASDTLVEIGTREYVILLPAAAGDEVPRMLARVGQGGAVSTFCYGLAACPGDATDPGALLALATSRLADAVEVHAPGRPLV